MRILPLLFASVLALINANWGSVSSSSLNAEKGTKGKILKVDMRLSAFGVESDDFPSIAASIDFAHNSSKCIKTYYNSAFKGSTYHLSSGEIMQVLTLLQKADLENTKKRFRVYKTDQPTSTITIYTEGKIYSIEDYGLEGAYPLQKLYSIVYKF